MNHISKARDIIERMSRAYEEARRQNEQFGDGPRDDVYFDGLPDDEGLAERNGACGSSPQ